MSEQQIEPRFPLNIEAAAAVARANALGFVQVGQQLIQQTLDTIDLSFELGRRVASCRTMAELWETQAEVGHQAIEAALQRGRRLADVGLTMTREVAEGLSESVNAATQVAAQQTAEATDQARAAMTGEQRTEAERQAASQQAREAAREGQRAGERPRQPQGQSGQPNRPSH